MSDENLYHRSQHSLFFIMALGLLLLFSDPGTVFFLPDDTGPENSTSPMQITLGDVNCDDDINSIDGLFILQHDVGLRDASDSCSDDIQLQGRVFNHSLCDVNADDVCSPIDALWILRCEVGLANPLCPDDPVDITGVILNNRSANCADYVARYTADALDVANGTAYMGMLTVAVGDSTCTFTSNAIPNHDFNDTTRFVNTPSEQDLSLTFTTDPQIARNSTPLSLQYNNAILLNGVKVDLLAAGCYGVGNGRVGCNDMSTPYRYDPMAPTANFGTDSHNAHTQPSGEYHYHGNPKALFNDSDNSTESPVIGFAADGFPIFGTYFDDNGTIRKALSSYQLKNGTRPSGSSSPSGPGGIYDGTFIDDYEYVERSGDLDACNGMTIDGVYGYFVTDSYPHILGCFSGTPDISFRKGGGGTTPTVPTPGTNPAASNPNLLLLIADDFGLDKATFDADNPCYDTGDASEDPAMPNLAALCQSGIRFDNAWAMPTCSPTRATMLTGQLPFRHGIGAPLGRGVSLSLDSTTLPGLLAASDSGYATANIGKWHVSNGLTDPNTLGWEHYSGILSGGIPDYERWSRTVNGVNETNTDYATTVAVDDAVSWLDGVPSEQPWLLWLAFNAPHTPFHKPPNELHDYDDLPEYENSLDPTPYFAAMSQSMDTEIGRLFDHLQATGEWENTVIIFIGDNGTSGQIASTPFSRQNAKGTLTQGGIAVPMMIAGPGVQGGRALSQMVSVVDIFATLLEGAGVDPAAQAPDVTFDSVSLWPLLSGESDAEVHTHIVAELFGNTVRDTADIGKAIRNERYKLICYEDGRAELFDLLEDPWERVDLIDDGTAPTAVIQTLAAELETLLDETFCSIEF